MLNVTMTMERIARFHTEPLILTRWLDWWIDCSYDSLYEKCSKTCYNLQHSIVSHKDLQNRIRIPWYIDRIFVWNNFHISCYNSNHIRMHCYGNQVWPQSVQRQTYCQHWDRLQAKLGCHSSAFLCGPSNI